MFRSDVDVFDSSRLQTVPEPGCMLALHGISLWGSFHSTWVQEYGFGDKLNVKSVGV